jgi:tRNA A37 threonylcarbamoyladenosine dehydratase
VVTGDPLKTVRLSMRRKNSKMNKQIPIKFNAENVYKRKKEIKETCGDVSIFN